jgi:hypothetical protein
MRSQYKDQLEAQQTPARDRQSLHKIIKQKNQTASGPIKTHTLNDVGTSTMLFLCNIDSKHRCLSGRHRRKSLRETAGKKQTICITCTDTPFHNPNLLAEKMCDIIHLIQSSTTVPVTSISVRISSRRRHWRRHAVPLSLQVGPNTSCSVTSITVVFGTIWAHTGETRGRNRRGRISPLLRPNTGASRIEPAIVIHASSGGVLQGIHVRVSHGSRGRPSVLRWGRVRGTMGHSSSHWGWWAWIIALSVTSVILLSAQHFTVKARRR